MSDFSNYGPRLSDNDGDDTDEQKPTLPLRFEHYLYDLCHIVWTAWYACKFADNQYDQNLERAW